MLWDEIYSIGSHTWTFMAFVEDYNTNWGPSLKEGKVVVFVSKVVWGFVPFRSYSCWFLCSKHF